MCTHVYVCMCVLSHSYHTQIGTFLPEVMSRQYALADDDDLEAIIRNVPNGANWHSRQLLSKSSFASWKSTRAKEQQSRMAWTACDGATMQPFETPKAPNLSTVAPVIMKSQAL